MVAAGMSAELAEQLKKQYVKKLSRSSSKHTLMDFFSNSAAKRALHDPELDMRQICLNYEPHTSRVSARKQFSSTVQASQAMGRVAPVRPMMMASSRQFSTKVQSDSSDSEAEEE